MRFYPPEADGSQWEQVRTLSTSRGSWVEWRRWKAGEIVERRVTFEDGGPDDGGGAAMGVPLAA